jgi:hypothetical protein
MVKASTATALQAQLERASGRSVPAVVAPVPVPAAATPETRPASARPPSREGKAHIGAYLSPDFKRSLRLVQAQTGEDTQTLIARALNELFRAHNVPVVDQS